MEGNKPNKPRRMIQVWMLANSYRKRPNNELEEWRRHTFEPALGGLAENRKKNSDDCKSFSSGNISSLRNCFVRQLIGLLLVYYSLQSHYFKYICRAYYQLKLLATL